MSKGLKALERIKTLSQARGMLNYPEIIEKFDCIEKELKVLDIIKELPKEENQNILNAIYTYTKSDEKYDLLVEVLK